MSDSTNPVTAVEPSVASAPAKAVDAANDHTPDPAAPPAVEHAPAPKDPGPDGLAQLTEVVTGLATTVDTLVTAVAHQAETKVHADESPGHVPWTHRNPFATPHHVTDAD